jgi:hypothetical protein
MQKLKLHLRLGAWAVHGVRMPEAFAHVGRQGSGHVKAQAATV